MAIPHSYVAANVHEKLAAKAISKKFLVCHPKNGEGGRIFFLILIFPFDVVTTILMESKTKGMRM